MSWNNGSEFFSSIIEILKDTVGDIPTRSDIYERLIPVFENADCDTLGECVGEDVAFDSVWETLYPTDTEEEYYDEETGDWIIEQREKSTDDE